MQASRVAIYCILDMLWVSILVGLIACHVGVLEYRILKTFHIMLDLNQGERTLKIYLEEFF